MAPNGTRAEGEAAAPSGDPPAVEIEFMVIRRLLDEGSSRDALARAKRLHKRDPAAAAEGIVIDAYVARIEALLARGLRPEASSMLDILLQRHRPFASPRRLDVARLCARLGDVAPLVAPLADADLPDADRREIEQAVARLVADPRALAECEALPSDHTLRVAARAVAEAFAAVTSGPVAPEAVALPEVSRRSPLAGWKMLCRAIAAASRGDAVECERCAALIDPDVAPALLVPVVCAMVDGAHGGRAPGEAVRTLAARLRPRLDDLRAALERLDRTMRGPYSKGLSKQIRDVMRLVDRSRPDLRAVIEPRLSVLACIHDVPVSSVRSGVGRTILKDAAFWRLFARGMEMLSHPMHACGAWALFARHAVAEGWFEADGLEAAALCLHMAVLLELIPAHEIDEERDFFLARFEGFAPMYGDQPKAVKRIGPRRGESCDARDLRPEELYGRAAAIAPQRAIFTRWLDWASGLPPNDPRRREALEAWHRALPQDVKPILELALCERRRGAFRKALAWVDKAEAIDPAGSEARTARLRLLVDAAGRHLRAGKPILLETDLAELAALPGSDEPARAALLAAVRALGDLSWGDREDALRWLREASRLLRSSSAASILVSAVAADASMARAAAELARGLESGGADETPGEERLVEGMARVCRVADDAGLYFRFAKPVSAALIRALDNASTRITARDALDIAEHALFLGADGPIAYAAAGAGLRGGDEGPPVARLLIARARAMQETEPPRAESCLLAAVTIARRHHDGATVAEALSAYEEAIPCREMLDEDAWREGLDDEEIARVLELERRSKRYRTTGRRTRRTKKKRSIEPTEYLFESPFDGPPPEPGGESDDLMAEVMATFGGLPDPDELLRCEPELAERLLDLFEREGLDQGPPRRGKERGNSRKRRKRRR